MLRLLSLVSVYGSADVSGFTSGASEVVVGVVIEVVIGVVQGGDFKM